MELNRKNAMKAWEDQFGKTVQAIDFAGRKIQKGAYEQKTSDYGWTLTYVVPKAEGGKFIPENIICVHVKTAEEKGDAYPMFTANEKKYGVKDGHYRGLKILKDTGVLKIILPELALGAGMEQNPLYHAHDVLEHCLQCAKFAHPSIRFSALLRRRKAPSQT